MWGTSMIKYKKFNDYVAIDFMTANQSLLTKYCQAITKE